jgi:hypothetical protein
MFGRQLVIASDASGNIDSGANALRPFILIPFF